MKLKRSHAKSPASLKLPPDYAQTLANLKTRIRQVQIKAALANNQELILLYWEIGYHIVNIQNQKSWGDSVVEQLAKDLSQSFPASKGFSERNLWNMRAFYLAYTEETKFLKQAASEMQKTHTIPLQILQQAASEIDGIHPPKIITKIPWFHNVILLQKLDHPALRLWYAQQAVIHGWSRAILTVQIESRLFERKGKALSNFKNTLTHLQSDLAQQTLKDPYIFDFLTLADDVKEKELEQRLMDHLQKFLLELGVGFAFVGRQVRLEINKKEFFIDLLFYHTRLKCYVVIELKTESFKPEYAGKMNFYLSAVDDLIRQSDDQPTIGLLLCKSKDKFVVEYALRDLKKPLGIAEWQTHIARSLPKEFKGALPSIKELEKEFLS